MPAVKEFGGCTILVVDDNSDTRDILRIVLKSLGCTIQTARDGDEAIAAFESCRPDLLLLDVNMPGRNGFEVCREVKARTATRWTPVVMLTVLDRPDAREEGVAAGADDYLTKPFDPELVKSRVRTLLRMRLAQITARHVVPADPSRAKPQRKDVTVLFADVRNFTAMADQLEPEEVAALLGEYLDVMGDAVAMHGGTVNKVMGDGLLVLFNDPIPMPDHSFAAIRAACEMRERALRLQAKFHSVLPEPFEVGIGLHTGPATVGAIGTRRVLDYTAIGATVNLAARLQQLAANEILATEAVYRGLEQAVDLRGVRRETLRGFAHPVRIAEIVEVKAAASPAPEARAGTAR